MSAFGRKLPVGLRLNRVEADVLMGREASSGAKVVFGRHAHACLRGRSDSTQEQHQGIGVANARSSPVAVSRHLTRPPRQLALGASPEC
jgi:hypothetical protein